MVVAGGFVAALDDPDDPESLPEDFEAPLSAPDPEAVSLELDEPELDEPELDAPASEEPLDELAAFEDSDSFALARLRERDESLLSVL